MESSWNFHGYVAVPLEKMGKSQDEIWCFSADDIESGSFTAAVLRFVRVFFKDDTILQEFEVKCEPFTNKMAREIPEESAKEIFEELYDMYLKELDVRDLEEYR